MAPSTNCNPQATGEQRTVYLPALVLTFDVFNGLMRPEASSPKRAIFMAADGDDDKAFFYHIYQTLLPGASLFKVDETFFLCARLDRVNMAAYNEMTEQQRYIVARYMAYLRIYLQVSGYGISKALRRVLGL
ncbi:unnamed protein product [Discula destructiva]